MSIGTVCHESRRIDNQLQRAFSEQWELKELGDDLRQVLNLDLPVEEWGREEGIDEGHLRERVEQAADAMKAAKSANIGPELMRFIEKSLLIQMMDAACHTPCPFRSEGAGLIQINAAYWGPLIATILNAESVGD